MTYCPCNRAFECLRSRGCLRWPVNLVGRGMTSQAVVLHSARPRISVERDDVYFAFADGAFGYDCVACGSKCCRGHGFYGSIENELAPFLGRRSLPLFMHSQGSEGAKRARIANLPPECFFLDADGGCEIHRTNGFAAKPETCRLFPFNRIRLVGRHLIVSPHSDLCPLRVMPPREPGTQSSHETLLDALCMRGIVAPLPSPPFDGGELESVLSRERLVRAESGSQLGESDFRSFLMSLLRLGEDPSNGDGKSLESFESTDELIGSLLGTSLEGLRSDDALASVLIACTPYVRTELLFPLVGADTNVQQSWDPVRLPHACLALGHIAVAAREAGMVRITFQSIARILVDFKSLIELLAHADVVAEWKRDAPIDFAGVRSPFERRALLAVAKGLLPGRKRSSPVLGAIVRAALPDAETDRAAALRTIADRLYGRITNTVTRPRQAVRQTPRKVLARFAQRMALRHLSEEVQLDAYSRLSALGALQMRV